MKDSVPIERDQVYQGMEQEKIVEKVNKSEDRHETSFNPATPLPSKEQDKIKTSEKEGTSKGKQRETPSTATTEALTDASFDSTMSTWSHTSQHHPSRFLYPDNQPVPSPGQNRFPYSDIMKSGSSPHHTLPYSKTPLFSPPFQITGFNYSPPITSPMPSTEQVAFSGQQVESSFKDSTFVPNRQQQQIQNFSRNKSPNSTYKGKK